MTDLPFMTDLQDKTHCPTLEEIGASIGNPLFQKFCTEIKAKYNCKEKIEFSSCSWEPGWNIKFKKFGKTLCTIYPRESFFTVMLVAGRKEKEPLEAILPECSRRMQEIYRETKEGNGQKWLMVSLEDEDDTYSDVFRLLDIRSAK